ncbi:uncharacterized protein [Penaeus vannamei]|uniref:uncharacterized protein n=1 Tax=Penaeus vannamei TaxID=6689 RepID=UPI00387F94F9
MAGVEGDAPLSCVLPRGRRPPGRSVARPHHASLAAAAARDKCVGVHGGDGCEERGVWSGRERPPPTRSAAAAATTTAKAAATCNTSSSSSLPARRLSVRTAVARDTTLSACEPTSTPRPIPAPATSPSQSLPLQPVPTSSASLTQSSPAVQTPATSSIQLSNSPPTPAPTTSQSLPPPPVPTPVSSTDRAAHVTTRSQSYSDKPCNAPLALADAPAILDAQARFSNASPVPSDKEPTPLGTAPVSSDKEPTPLGTAPVPSNASSTLPGSNPSLVLCPDFGNMKTSSLKCSELTSVMSSVCNVMKGGSGEEEEEEEEEEEDEEGEEGEDKIMRKETTQRCANRYDSADSSDSASLTKAVPLICDLNLRSSHRHKQTVLQTLRTTPNICRTPVNATTESWTTECRR